MPTSPESTSIRGFQDAFARRLRDPAASPLPSSVPERRMAVYEELVFNNLKGFIDTAFPITREIVSEAEWQRTLRRFAAGHRCRSPLFRDIAEEFLGWFVPMADTLFPDRPWLAEFMHYEWIELAAEVAEDPPGRDVIDPDGDLMKGCPALHPSVHVGCYRHPLHRVSPRRLPQEREQGSYCYLVMRASDDRIRFHNVNPAVGWLIERIDQRDGNGEGALLALAEHLGVSVTATFLEQGQSMLSDLRRQGTLIGTWRK